MWATNDPDARFQFEPVQAKQAKQARRIKTLSMLSAVLLPVTIALHYLLPPSPAAAVFVGFLGGFGVSIPIGIILALVLERMRSRTDEVQP
jgi:hypothetical protein